MQFFPFGFYPRLLPNFFVFSIFSLKPLFSRAARIFPSFMSSYDESSWHLLFDIALSHGAALRAQHLRFSSWMVFLSAAQLLGPKTGVYPALLDQLWYQQRHPRPSTLTSKNENRECAGGRSRGGRLGTARGALFAESASDGEPNTSTFVTFDGFLDMMKVVCVRAYQTHLCNTLHAASPPSEKEEILNAIELSAEDRVFLAESVQYAAETYLRKFIAQSIIRRDSVVRLLPSLNGWGLQAQRLATHVVGSTVRTVLRPLFNTYATCGRLSEQGYKLFLRDVFSHFSPLESACGLAIFTGGGFEDARPSFADIEFSSGGLAVPFLDDGDEDLLSREKTLSFADFVDAILMLSIVVYADVDRFPHHRPITAKVWSLFEKFINPAVGVAMAPDPLLTGTYASIRPQLVSVYPTFIPINSMQSVLLSGFNMYLKNQPATHRPALSIDYPRDGKASAAIDQGGSTSPQLADSSSFLTELALPVAPLVERGSKTKPMPKSPASSNPFSVISAASNFFSNAFSLLETNNAVPLFGGSPRCCVLLNEEAVDAVCVSAELVKLQLPSALSHPLLYRCAITVALQTNGQIKLHYTPVRVITVGIAEAEPEDAAPQADLGPSFDTQDILLVDMSSTQVIEQDLANNLRELFLSHATSSVAIEATSPPPLPPSTVGKTLSMEAFCFLCRQLRLISTTPLEATQTLASSDPSIAICEAAVQHYVSLARLFHEKQFNRGDEELLSSHLFFRSFIGSLAMVVFQSMGSSLEDLPDVPGRLAFAVAAFLKGSASAKEGNDVTESSGASEGVALGQASLDVQSTIPYNALIEVPYLAALLRQQRISEEAMEYRTDVLEQLYKKNTELVRQARGRSCTLPALSADLDHGMKLVSQYGVVDEAAGFKSSLQETRDVLKREFLHTEMMIPPPS